MIFDSRPDNTNGFYPTFGITNTGTLSYIVNNVKLIESTATIPTGQWNHLALVHVGTNTNIYMNGVSIASTTTDSSNLLTSTVKIGTNAFRSTATDTYFQGYLSNIRVVKGTALYTGTFTPSTTPLPAVANTILLACRSLVPSDDISGNNSIISPSGNPGANYFNPFNSANGATLLSGANTWTFSSSNTQNITTNSYIHDFPITFAGTGTVAPSGY
jgi:hypothetical protein